MKSIFLFKSNQLDVSHSSNHNILHLIVRITCLHGFTTISGNVILIINTIYPSLTRDSCCRRLFTTNLNTTRTTCSGYYTSVVKALRH